MTWTGHGRDLAHLHVIGAIIVALFVTRFRLKQKDAIDKMLLCFVARAIRTAD